MILTCNNCDTDFKLPKELLKPMGKKVRCVVCGNTWFADILHKPALLNEISTIDLFKKLSLKHLKVLSWPIAVATLLSTIFFQNFWFQLMPSSYLAYNYLGLPVTHNVSIQDLAVSIEENHIIVSGNITNSSEYNLRVPSILVEVEGAQTVINLLMPSPSKYISKGQKYHFYKRIKTQNTSTAKAEVNIASTFDILRSKINFLLAKTDI